MNKTECPNCKSKIGFAFGRCCECGYNYRSKEFEKISVDVDDLPVESRFYLIHKHEKRTKRD